MSGEGMPDDVSAMAESTEPVLVHTTTLPAPAPTEPTQRTAP